MTPASREVGRGVIYVATGAAHVEAARRSAVSVRRTNPGLGIALLTDRGAAGPEFDRVEPIANPHARSKVDHLAATPFAETLYLDTDTRVLGDLHDMFRLLERFELAAAHRVPDPRRLFRPRPEAPPAAFPEHNTGVLLYRAEPRVLAFFEDWRRGYAQAGLDADQISFREALWRSELRLAVLPKRFNTRRWTWIDHWIARGPRPVILHTNRFHPSKGTGRKGLLARLSGPAS